MNAQAQLVLLLQGSEFMSHLFSCQHGFIQCSFFLNLFHPSCRLFCCMLLMVLAATVVGRIRTESRRAFVLLDIIFTCELITETTLFQLPCYGDKTDGGFTEMLCHLVRRKCRQYLQVILLPGGWMVFPSSSVKLLLTSCQSIFSCIDRASVVSRSCRRVFSGNASTATEFQAY